MNQSRKDFNTKKDNNLLEKKKWQKFVNEYKGKEMIIQSEFGIIDMAKDAMKDIYKGDELTYEEYLEALFNSRNNIREYFEYFYYSNASCFFKGRISRFDRGRGKVIFERIYVFGVLMDGECCEGKEDHVWMDIESFEKYNEGDCLSFNAEIYRYLKTKNGKQISFALKNPCEISKVNAYELPSDEELLRQSVEKIVCEICIYNDQCYTGLCIANEKWREDMENILLDVYKRMEK